MVKLDNISFIEDSHGKKAVIVSFEAYEAMQKKLEEFDDIETFLAHERSNEEEFPIELVKKLVIGDLSKIKILREFREITRSKMSELLGISEAYLSQIEHKKRNGSVDLYKKAAEILDVDIDMLV